MNFQANKNEVGGNRNETKGKQKWSSRETKMNFEVNKNKGPSKQKMKLEAKKNEVPGKQKWSSKQTKMYF